MVLIDTSVWIDFLKKVDPYYKIVMGLLMEQRVVTNSLIFGELLQGVRNKREKEMLLEFWSNLPKTKEEHLALKAGIYSNEQKLYSKGVGLIDCMILVSALENGYRLATKDKKLAKVVPYNSKFSLAI